MNNKNTDVLKLETRKKIFEIVKKNTGCHFREIERISNIPYGTLKYHLNFLVKHKLITEQKDKNNIRYFPLEFNSKSFELLSVLRQKNLRKIILFILTNKKTSHENLVNFLKLSPSTVSWHLKKLIDKQIIVATKKGRKTIYELSTNKDEILSLLITYKESFLDVFVDRVIEMFEL